MLLAMGHKRLSLYIKSTSNHLKTHLYKNRTISSYLGEKANIMQQSEVGKRKASFSMQRYSSLLHGILTTSIFSEGQQENKTTSARKLQGH